MNIYHLKRLAMALGICSALGFLSGCQQDAPTSQNSMSQTTINNPAASSATVSQTVSSDHHQLQVNDRCVGCGKCARIAPDTFAMQGRTSYVYSQDHISSSQVQQAMRMCPVSAIEIIEV